MQKSFIQVEDGKLAYLAGGKGKNLILLHRLNLSADSWDKVFGALSQGHSVYALDMFGHGDSEKPPRIFAPKLPPPEPQLKPPGMVKGWESYDRAGRLP